MSVGRSLPPLAQGLISIHTLCPPALPDLHRPIVSLLQVGLSGVNQLVPGAVDAALAAQLGAHIAQLMGPGGDMAASIKAAVDAAMAGSIQRVKVGSGEGQ